MRLFRESSTQLFSSSAEQGFKKLESYKLKSSLETKLKTSASLKGSSRPSIRFEGPSQFIDFTDFAGFAQHAAIRHCSYHRDFTGYHYVNRYYRQHLCLSCRVLESLHEESTSFVVGKLGHRWCWNVSFLHAFCRRYCFIPWTGRRI